jgi:pantetheine-phosphate adenylyltransferase
VTTALYPGSFDPFHAGHLAVVEQAAAIFDVVAVAVLGNPTKPTGMFTISERLEIVEAATRHLDNVSCVAYDGLTVDLARREQAEVLIRSGHKDMRAERAMAATNDQLGGVRTVFVAADATTRNISSSLIRSLIRGGDHAAAARLMPPVVVPLVLGPAHAPMG